MLSKLTVISGQLTKTQFRNSEKNSARNSSIFCTCPGNEVSREEGLREICNCILHFKFKNPPLIPPLRRGEAPHHEEFETSQDSKNLSPTLSFPQSPQPAMRAGSGQVQKRGSKKYIFGQKGSIMMQVLVSLFILSLGLSGALAVIVAAIESNKTNQQRMIATNLAQEGMEGFRSIRDTNWLTYSSNLRECWHFWEDTNEDGVLGNDSSCTPDGNGQNDHPWTFVASEAPTDTPLFIVDFDSTNFRWKYIPDTLFDNISGTPDYTDGHKLYTKTINGNLFYTHDKSGTTTESVFSRKMEMYFIDNPTFDDSTDPITGGEYPDSTTASPPATTEMGDDNRILVMSTVSWTQRGRSHEVVMSTIMTDYLERTEWDS